MDTDQFSSLLVGTSGLFGGPVLTCPECRMQPEPEDAGVYGPRDFAPLVHFEYVLVRSHDLGLRIRGECEVQPTAGLGQGRGTAVTFGLWCEAGHRWEMSHQFHKGTIGISTNPLEPRPQLESPHPDVWRYLPLPQEEMWRD